MRGGEGGVGVEGGGYERREGVGKGMKKGGKR